HAARGPMPAPSPPHTEGGKPATQEGPRPTTDVLSLPSRAHQRAADNAARRPINHRNPRCCDRLDREEPRPGDTGCHGVVGRLPSPLVAIDHVVCASGSDAASSCTAAKFPTEGWFDAVRL